ncbi:Hypothetical protein, putative [Bodo saltans]|uniref:C3H1-type domain-containing protein n=1 Tax=Bodo saltans TaxID=75058 RepID=A0A0S4JDI8_BODSA|nr:Hypothetical protein, putative [Bodo saltans]|eukprot:CUG88322.1 Hypothetical protein, putative [Bodo saltans]
MSRNQQHRGSGSYHHSNTDRGATTSERGATETSATTASRGGFQRRNGSPHNNNSNSHVDTGTSATTFRSKGSTKPSFVDKPHHTSSTSHTTNTNNAKTSSQLSSQQPFRRAPLALVATSHHGGAFTSRHNNNNNNAHQTPPPPGPPGSEHAHVNIRSSNGTLWYHNQPYLSKLQPQLNNGSDSNQLPLAILRARSAGQARDASGAQQQPSVNYCRHYLLGQCNRGTMCRFAHLEQHTVVVRESREGKPLRAHSHSSSTSKARRGVGQSPPPPPPPPQLLEDDNNGGWGEDGGNSLGNWEYDQEEGDRVGEDDGGVDCSSSNNFHPLNIRTNFSYLPNSYYYGGGGDEDESNSGNDEFTAPRNSTSNSNYGYQKSVLPMPSSSSSKHNGGVSPLVHNEQQQYSSPTTTTAVTSASALYASSHRPYYHNGPTPSPDASSTSPNASFSHNPYPPTTYTVNVPHHPGGADYSDWVPTLSPGGSVRVHHPYLGAPLALPSSSSAFEHDEASSSGAVDELDQRHGTDGDVSPSPSSAAPHMPARSNTEVFEEDPEVTVVEGRVSSQPPPQRASSDFQSCDDGGEYATTSSLRSTVQQQQPLHPYRSPPSVLPMPSYHLHGTAASVASAGRSPTMSNTTPITSVHASPSCQPSLFSQMPAGYDEEEMDLLMLPSAHVDTVAKFTAQQRAFSLMVGPMAVPAASAIAGGNTGNTTVTPSPEQHYASVTSHPSSLTRYPGASSAGGAVVVGRSGELASSSEQHTPRLGYQQPAGKQSPAVPPTWPAVSPDEELIIKTLW